MLYLVGQKGDNDGDVAEEAESYDDAVRHYQGVVGRSPQPEEQL